MENDEKFANQQINKVKFFKNFGYCQNGINVFYHYSNHYELKHSLWQGNVFTWGGVYMTTRGHTSPLKVCTHTGHACLLAMDAPRQSMPQSKTCPLDYRHPTPNKVRYAVNLWAVANLL